MESTRIVFLVCVLVTISGQYIISPDNSEQSYRPTISLISDYNSHTSNPSEILSVLTEASLDNPSALTKLGEYWLFGYPIASGSPHKRAVTKRNITRAYEYFSEAHSLNDPDASFFIHFMHKQGRFLKEFSDIPQVPLSMDSWYTKGLTLAAYQACLNSHNVPVPYHMNSQYESYFAGCGSCRSKVESAYLLARDTIDYLQEETAVHTPGELLHKKKQKGSPNALKLYSKYTHDTGDTKGMVQIADNYLHGNPDLNLQSNIPEAIRHYEQAAASNNTEALESLGHLHLHNSPTNHTKAIEYLTRAAALGSTNALTGLGYIHIQGLGVPVDRAKGFAYLKEAADLGDVQSMANIGVAYMNGIGVKKNLALAKAYLTVAAEHGQINAMFNLGRMYYEGIGVGKSCRIALELFQAVIEKGRFNFFLKNALVSYGLGDYEGAYLMFALSADLGLEHSQLNTAYIWENELPFTPKVNKRIGSSEYYTKAALGHRSEYAFLQLGKMLFYGFEGVEPDYSQAYKMFNIAQKFPDAVFAMGYMNQHGLGVKKDENKAAELYRSIVEKAEGQEFESDAKYPAEIALFLIDAKEKLGTFPYLGGLIDYVSEWLM